MYHHDKPYLDLAHKILTTGEHHDDRTGVGTTRLFGEQLKFDLRHTFPLLTSKRLFTKGIVVELLWMLAGETNVRKLWEENVHIWDEWADERGDLGPVYGKQWRAWEGRNINYGPTSKYGGVIVDQLRDVIASIRNNPNSRRHIVTAWNPAEVQFMALPPCHCFFQFCVRHDGHLDMQLYQRSADMFLGVPFNIASYALLLSLIAQCTGYKAGTFTHTFGDVHIYDNHKEQMWEQMSRTLVESPTLQLNPMKKLLFTPNGNIAWSREDISFVKYNPHPAIKGEVAV